MPLQQNIRVLIVDDSLFFRTTLERALREKPRIEVVGTAVDCFDALKKIEALKPDVITMDVEMPKLSGIDFLKQLLPKHPIPVVLVSAANIKVFEALSAGAVDFARKPNLSKHEDFAAFVDELANMVVVASKAKVRGGSQTDAARTSATSPLQAQDAGASMALPALSPLAAQRKDVVIAIGASTGGTEAILSVVKDLPANTPGIVIVQHMPAVFTRMYAERLDRICKMHVCEATDNERVEPGKIIIGAGEFHLRLAKDVRGYYVTSKPGEKVSGHCPSVDVLFESVATVAGSRAMGVILTGMGRDGATGLLRMRHAGAYTVGQDQESSVVYGMPMVAFQIGGVVKQLPLGQIGREIIQYLNK